MKTFDENKTMRTHGPISGESMRELKEPLLIAPMLFWGSMALGIVSLVLILGGWVK